jgi:hypothetical protein
VQLDLLMASANQMINDVGGRGVAAGAAEPFVAGEALDDASRIVNAAITAQRIFLATMFHFAQLPHTKTYAQA